MIFLLKLVLSDIKNLGLEEFVEVRSFEGLLVNYAKKIDAKIQLDGVLNEPIWDEAEKADDFWQIFPTDSLRATNKTVVKLLYDDAFLYVSATAKGIGPDFRVNSLRRDFSARSNDNVTVIFDTFKDGQNAFLFGVSAFGVQREALISDRGTQIRGFNLTWDIKWEAATTRNEDSFVIEIAIPFSSLKYPEGSQKWGFQSYRYDMQSNERSNWTNIDQNQIPMRGLRQLYLNHEIDIHKSLSYLENQYLFLLQACIK